MPKNKIIEKKFYNDTYELEVSFLFGGTVDDLKNFMRSRHGAEAKFYSWDKEFKLYEQENNTNGYQFHIFTPVGNADIFYTWMAELDISLFFHEIHHLPNDILQTIGVKLSEDSEEAAAYLAGWIGKKICEALNVKIKMPTK